MRVKRDDAYSLSFGIVLGMLLGILQAQVLADVARVVRPPD